MATTLATWPIDLVHSSVEFSLDYMCFSTYRTGFRALEGSLEFDAARPAASSVNASIPVASVDVTNDRLMSRLMDPDLLGGRGHPTITFKSTRVEALDLAHRKVTGDLTIHGVAQPVVLDTRYLGQAKHPFSGKIAAAFRAETAIDRRCAGGEERRRGAGVPRTPVPSTGPLYRLCSFRSAVGRRHGRSQPPCATRRRCTSIPSTGSCREATPTKPALP